MPIVNVIDVWLFTAVGLLIGSFLNVVVYRLPKMMERQWAKECAELAETEVPDSPTFNLSVPRSACPHCGHQIKWYENIPVVSYVALRGACSGCKKHISLRYPLVEVVTGLLFLGCATRYGTGSAGLAACGFSATLLALALIDWDTTLLPDDLTLPLLWAGLIAAEMHWSAVGLNDAIWGAVAGYLSLWLVYWGFKLATGKEGMGYGDFKLFAALGAWFGWQALTPIILIASILGAIVGLAMKAKNNLREGGYVPFGPFLAGAGFAALWLGPKTMANLLM
jgi:leader peptidase (prepilin peptidase) / N-methyltransferase